MRTLTVFCVLMILVLVGYSREHPAAPQLDGEALTDFDPQFTAADIMASAGWEFADDMQTPEKADGLH